MTPLGRLVRVPFGVISSVSFQPTTPTQIHPPARRTFAYDHPSAHPPYYSLLHCGPQWTLCRRPTSGLPVLPECILRDGGQAYARRSVVVVLLYRAPLLPQHTPGPRPPAVLRSFAILIKERRSESLSYLTGLLSSPLPSSLSGKPLFCETKKRPSLLRTKASSRVLNGEWSHKTPTPGGRHC